jgi:hypothetical protein
LVTNQKAGGEWRVDRPIDGNATLSTAFALRFLASRPD